MCTQYRINTSIENILEELTLDSSALEEPVVLPEVVLPFRHAPVVYRRQDKTVLSCMQFSLTPSWSKERRPKFATYNARLDGLSSKATWKKPFSSRRCAVPLTDFVEPVYRGEYAGNMIRFSDKRGSLLVAAGIYDIWHDPLTDQVLQSFAIITDEAGEYIRTAGHDRQPVFLDRGCLADWLDPQRSDVNALKKMLLENIAKPQWQTAIDRPLKAGWEKRVKD